jgi:hypothetical protein
MKWLVCNKLRIATEADSLDCLCLPMSYNLQPPLLAHSHQMQHPRGIKKRIPQLLATPCMPAERQHAGLCCCCMYALAGPSCLVV